MPGVGSSFSPSLNQCAGVYKFNIYVIYFRFLKLDEEEELKIKGREQK